MLIACGEVVVLITNYGLIIKLVILIVRRKKEMVLSVHASLSEFI